MSLVSSAGRGTKSSVVIMNSRLVPERQTEMDERMDVAGWLCGVSDIRVILVGLTLTRQVVEATSAIAVAASAAVTTAAMACGVVESAGLGHLSRLTFCQSPAWARRGHGGKGR